MNPLEGRVRTSSLEALLIDGLEGAALHDRVELEGGGQGLVTAVLRDGIEAVPLDGSPVTPGSGVRTAGTLAVPSGDELLGRQIDAIGRALDGGPPPGSRTVCPVFFPPPPRNPESPFRRWTTGLLVYDLQNSLPLGGAILAAGEVPFILQHLLRHQETEGRVCIYARPAPTGSARLTYRDVLERSGRQGKPAARPLPRALFVESGRDPSPAARWLVPWTAMAIGAALSERERDVVVILDSLEAWRRAVDRFPNEGDWLGQIGRLASLCRSGPRGSLTLVAAASVRTSRELDSFFDARIDLGRALQGYPPRQPTKIVRPPIKTDPRLLGWAVSSLAQLEEIETHAPRAAVPGAAPFKDARRLQAALRFRHDLTPDSAEQLLSFLAVCELGDLPDSRVEEFVGLFEERLRLEHGPMLAAVRKERVYAEKDRAAMASVAKDLCKSLLRQAGGRP